MKPERDLYDPFLWSSAEIIREEACAALGGPSRCGAFCRFIAPEGGKACPGDITLRRAQLLGARMRQRPGRRPPPLEYGECS